MSIVIDAAVGVFLGALFVTCKAVRACNWVAMKIAGPRPRLVEANRRALELEHTITDKDDR